MSRDRPSNRFVNCYSVVVLEFLNCGGVSVHLDRLESMRVEVTGDDMSCVVDLRESRAAATKKQKREWARRNRDKLRTYRQVYRKTEAFKVVTARNSKDYRDRKKQRGVDVDRMREPRTLGRLAGVFEAATNPTPQYGVPWPARLLGSPSYVAPENL
jgi:hypothetical protein